MDTSNIGTFSFVSGTMLLVVVTIYSLYLQRKEKQIKKEKDNLHHQSQHLIEQAQSKAENIILKAERKAETILDQVDTFKAEVEKSFKKTLMQSAGQETEQFKKEMKDLSLALKSSFNQTKAEYLKEEKESLQSMTSVINDEKISSEAYLKQKIDKEYEKARAEITAFKEDQLKNINLQVGKLVQDLARQLLGKGLTINDQEKLVMEAVEKARKEGLFN